jgi:hypothetical protein
MDPTALVNVDGGARFLAEFQKHFCVQTAFWLKESGKEKWYLYIDALDITDENFDTAYGIVLDIALASTPPFDPFQVKLIHDDRSLTKAVLAIHRYNPGQSLLHLQGETLDGLTVEWVYIYRLPVASAVA